LRRCLAVISFVLCLPSLFLSVILLKDFVRIHRGQFYYFNYPYGTRLMLWAAVTALLAGLAAHTFFRRSYYGVLPALAIIIGLLTIHITPDLVPTVSMLSTNVKQLGHAEKALSDWDETHGRFPANRDELREALARVLAEPSHFSFGNTTVVCKYELISEAVAASLKTAITQPCVLIYAVRADYREYWLTETTLEKPTSGGVVVATGIANQPFIVHRTHLNPGEGHWPHFE